MKRQWTQEEDELILALYPGTLAATLAQQIGRTVKAVRQRAKKLGVKQVWGAGRPPRNWRPIGSERLDRGRLIRKVTDTGNPKKDWKRVDVIEWEAVNGPLPEGRRLTLLSADLPRTLANLEPRTPQEHFQMVSVHSMPPELAALYQLKGQITQEIRRREKAETQA